MIKKVSRGEVRKRKHVRVRKKVSGTSDKPRLSVFRSAKNIYAQIIDDTNGVTLVSASTVDPSLKGKVKFGGNKEAAQEVGKLVAKRAIENGVINVVFDRGGFLYHGRVKELAESARNEGLSF